MNRYLFGNGANNASGNYSLKEGAIHMKLFIPIAGTLATIGCAVWVYLSHTSRRQVVLYKTSCTESEFETT